MTAGCVFGFLFYFGVATINKNSSVVQILISIAIGGPLGWLATNIFCVDLEKLKKEELIKIEPQIIEIDEAIQRNQ